MQFVHKFSPTARFYRRQIRLPFTLCLALANLPAPGAVLFQQLKALPNLYGGYAKASLLVGTDGSLYGAAGPGDSLGAGLIFSIHPDGSSYATLHYSTGLGGPARNFLAPLIEGTDGALYGASLDGDDGSCSCVCNPYWTGCGTVFKLNKDGSNYTRLYQFNGSVNSSRNPFGGLIQASDGAFYGTADGDDGPQGYFPGIIFKLNSNGTGFTNLHSFNSAGDGEFPVAGLLEASDGELYGTTSDGGSNSWGVVFALQKDGTGYRILHHFPSVPGDGQYPVAPLIEGSDGALYGTTQNGGAAGSGSVFKLDKTGLGYLVLHNFQVMDPADGSHPLGGLLEGSDGALYGTTYSGGTGSGTVFKVNKDGTGYKILYKFNGSEGSFPAAALVRGPDGAFYGTTAFGGTSGSGTVFKFWPQTPEIIDVTTLSGSAQVRLTGMAGSRYQLLRSTDLLHWTGLPAFTMPASGDYINVDSSAPTPAAFYRVAWLPYLFCFLLITQIVREAVEISTSAQIGSSSRTRGQFHIQGKVRACEGDKGARM